MTERWNMAGRQRSAQALALLGTLPQEIGGALTGMMAIGEMLPAALRPAVIDLASLYMAHLQGGVGGWDPTIGPRVEEVIEEMKRHWEIGRGD